jgi:3-methyladenine DNA glycosylase AlkD
LSLPAKVRRALRAVANPENAPAMQAYMKTTTPFLGCSAKPMRAACKETFRDLAFDDVRSWRRAVLGLWRGAKYREERYAAVELCAHRCSRPFRDALEALPAYQEMIVTGAWWDLVDALATHRVGGVLHAHPKETKTSRCSRTASRRRSREKNSGCARPSAGRCAPTHTPTWRG